MVSRTYSIAAVSLAGITLAGCATGPATLHTRAGLVMSQYRADQKACYDKVDRGTYVPTGYSNGTVAGAAGAGAAAGVAEVLQKHRLTNECLNQLGYRDFQVPAEQANKLRALRGEEKERYLEELMKQASSPSPVTPPATSPRSGQRS